MLDSLGRTIDYARISVTDRCNLRCVYCLGEQGDPGPAGGSLDFDDILRLARVLAGLGVVKFKVTGGEPTLRGDLAEIVRALKATPGVANVTLTTNGLLLDGQAQDLALAGLDAVNVSLDSLDPHAYRRLSGADALGRALAGLAAAREAGIPSIKVNCVPLAQTTPGDLLALAGLAREHETHVRFIELMPIGPGALLPPPRGNDAILRLLEASLGPMAPSGRALGNGPASYFSVRGFKGRIGFISALGSCFCALCNRVRITSDGFLKTCLHMDGGIPLPLSDEGLLRSAILEAVRRKPERHLFGTGPGCADGRTMARIGG
ncbi:MAG: GTP 3',8-cyclase MoaA [Deltaproteobacteria bacterium]|jgi:cyclic pyranopterin phosphate synthase|nr:GTP 3',8-cyclase MoaA [Deltaproteobacteria bacterium]